MDNPEKLATLST